MKSEIQEIISYLDVQIKGIEQNMTAIEKLQEENYGNETEEGLDMDMKLATKEKDILTKKEALEQARNWILAHF